MVIKRKESEMQGRTTAGFTFELVQDGADNQVEGTIRENATAAFS